jgi:transcriptional regulator with GAF, ATPase, and Fis domain
VSAHSAELALAQMLGALVREHETADLLSALVRECATVLPADAVALLVRHGAHGLELLSATSHRAAELEVYQAQQDEGPCVDTLRTGEQVMVVGVAEIADRWPDVGPVIGGAGFAAVHAFPMTWHGTTLGGLNVFSAQAVPLAEESSRLAQNFADVATLALAQPGVLEEDTLDERIRAALAGRVVIEQAKGVLAQSLGLDPADAYDHLLRLVIDTGSTLSATAREVIRTAHERGGATASG